GDRARGVRRADYALGTPPHPALRATLAPQAGRGATNIRTLRFVALRPACGEKVAEGRMRGSRVWRCSRAEPLHEARHFRVEVRGGGGFGLRRLGRRFLIPMKKRQRSCRSPKKTTRSR